MIRKTAIISSESREQVVKHYTGFPPEVAPGESRQMLPLASVLVIEEKEDGVFLCRYTDEGESAGDTWHLTVDEALEQAEIEYGVSPSEWVDVPVEVSDVYGFLFPDKRS